MQQEEPVFVLRTPGEAICGLLVVMQVGSLISAVLRSLLRATPQMLKALKDKWKG